MNKDFVCNPFSSSGAGTNFENHVQVFFALLMITNGLLPWLPAENFLEMQFQGKVDGFQTDDMIIYYKDTGSDKEKKILTQIKHSINITKNDKIFYDVIRAAWSDFNNGKIFNKKTDSFALITGPLSKRDITDTRVVLEWARYAPDSKDYLNKIYKANFSSTVKINKYEAFKSNLIKSNDCQEITDEAIHDFLRHFYILGFDLDVQFGMHYSLLYSILQNYTDRPKDLWNQVLQEVVFLNQNAGKLSKNALTVKIREYLKSEGVIKNPHRTNFGEDETKEDFWNLSTAGVSVKKLNLIGAWDENKLGDEEIIKRIVEDLEKWNSQIHELFFNNTHLLTLQNGKWRINNRLSLWKQVAERVFDNDIRKIEECVLMVLSEIDPQLDLPSESRILGGIQGKGPKYSSDLRQGLAETVALMGNYGDELMNCSHQLPVNIAKSIVWKLTKNKDWKAWASLNYLLPTLAESAPHLFLTIVESEIEKISSVFDILFKKEDSGIMGQNYMTGLLWALEGLAWEEEFLPQVLLILASLANRDPGGNYANRPLNSIINILLPWHPQTLGSFEKRIAGITAICSDYPEIAWKTLFALMPNQTNLASNSYRPKWRKISLDHLDIKISKVEYLRQVEEYQKVMIEMAQKDVSKLIQLTKMMDDLTDRSREFILRHLSCSSIMNLSEGNRYLIWSALTEFVSKHRKYPDAEWSLKTEDLKKVEEVIRTFEVGSWFTDKYLFENDGIKLFQQQGNWSEQQSDLIKKRKEIINRILHTKGIHGVVEFYHDVKHPEKVGYSLGMIQDKEVDNFVIPSLFHKSDEKSLVFLKAFISSRFHSQGLEWVDSFKLNEWTTDEKCRFLIHLPFKNEVWDRAKDWLGESEDVYWEEVQPNLYDSINLNYAIDKFLAVERPLLALSCIYRLSLEKKQMDTEKTIEVLEHVMSSADKRRPPCEYEVIEIIKQLQTEVDIDINTLTEIEWFFLPILNGHYGARPRCIEKRLATEPNFFCEIIQMLFKSSDKSSKQFNPKKYSRRTIQNACNLLFHWKRPPGLLDDGNFSIYDLKNWLSQVKKICRHSGRLDAALEYVGKVLFYSPPGQDGLWINENVAGLMNEKDADIIRRGYGLEALNSRGVYYVDPTGKPEYQLSEFWGNRASDIENKGYIRFASTLKEIAHSYENEAKRVIAEHKQDENEVS
jgi:hypothetical protein